MLRHQDCGGELRKARQFSTWYRCRRCSAKLKLGATAPAGIDKVKHRLAGVRTHYEVPPAEENEGMSLHTSLVGSGGKVVVVGGTMNPNWAVYAKHPQVLFWCGDKSEISRHIRPGWSLPDNTKAVIISRFIGHSEGGKVIEEARKKRALIMNGLNDGEVTRKLEEILTPPNGQPTNAQPLRTSEVVPARPTPPPTPVVTDLRPPNRGEIKIFIERHYNAALPNIDNVRVILAEMLKQGVTSTEESIAQSVYQFKKAAGITSPRAITSKGRRIENRAPETKVVLTRAKDLAKEADEIAKLPERPATVAAPRTVKPKATPAGEDALIKLLDDSIAGLQLVREQVIEFKGQRNDYLRLKAKLADILKGE